MNKKSIILLLVMLIAVTFCGCTSGDKNIHVVENKETEENNRFKLMIEGEYLGVNMKYDSETGECYIDTDDIRLIDEDGTVKNIVERLGGKYECFKFSNKAKWQIGTTEWEVRFVRSKIDNGSKIASFKAYRDGEAISICDGYAEVIKDDTIVGNFKLSTKDLESLLQVQAEINYEEGTVNLVQVYTN